MITFEPSINLGTLIHLVSLIVTVVSLYFGLRLKIESVRHEILKLHTEATTRLVALETAIAYLNDGPTRTRDPPE